MPVRLIITVFGLLCCLLLLFIRSYGSFEEPKKQLPVKRDTTYKHMTPVHIRETGDRKNFEIVFLESARFFYLRKIPVTNQTTLSFWKKLIADKHKVIIGFTEELGGNAKIISIQPYNL